LGADRGVALRAAMGMVLDAFLGAALRGQFRLFGKPIKPDVGVLCAGQSGIDPVRAS
jgi:hypothetical protein